MNPLQHKTAAREFVARWQAAEGNEQREAQKFWIELLGEVLNVPQPTRLLDFERKVQGRRIDVFLEDIGVLIEHKSRGADLDKSYERGKDEGGAARMVTPFEQAKWYADNLPRTQSPRWLIVCNFDQIRIHDLNLEAPAANYETIPLAELPNLLHRLSFLTRKENSRLEREKQLSVEAGAIVGKLYDALAARYHNIESDAAEQRSLNILITRIVFLLYAEDAGLLQAHQAFYTYLKDYNADATADALRHLFTVLRTPEAERSKLYVPESAQAFPYITGGLFADDTILIPPFDAPARALLLQEASAGFDWKDISPTIFGAVFESTLNPDTRRAAGMHYTSIENIHKVTDPLFFDALRAELAQIEGEKQQKKREFLLHAYRKKLAALKIFDPACGSGNFLTETYIGLRKLENRVLENLYGAQMGIGEADPIQVSIKQFFGLEINDFAVEVAKTALWIAELQMLEQTQEILKTWIEPLPLKDNTHIHCANALRTDWNDVLPARECSYIIGNPPFLGARTQSKEQKAELMAAFGDARNSGNVDYVAGWFVKAADYIADAPVRCAFVATNSICQGEQVANVWHPLHQRGVHIDFAHTTFRWRNEAREQAHVFVVIVGFSKQDTEKTLFHYANPDAAAETQKPARINAYLADAPDVFVWSRNTPLCDVPEIGIGNKPIDGGNYLFKADEKSAFLAREPAAEKYFHPWLGADEFLKGNRRWVLWLGDATPQELESLPLCRERIENVRQLRLASKSAPTQKLARTPTRFHVENMPQGDSVVIPEVSSERRFYVPLGFISPDVICSNKVRLIPDATLYHFGVLHSQFNNAWLRAVGGRLKSDYDYSIKIVYNNFIWPNPNDAQRQHIETCAQNVLDARAAHPGATLAQLYDPDKMPANLRAAHHALDAAVEAAYGVDFGGDEEKITAHLFQLSAADTRRGE